MLTPFYYLWGCSVPIIFCFNCTFMFNALHLALCAFVLARRKYHFSFALLEHGGVNGTSFCFLYRKFHRELFVLCLLFCAEALLKRIHVHFVPLNFACVNGVRCQVTMLFIWNVVLSWIWFLGSVVIMYGRFHAAWSKRKALHGMKWRLC